ncbi:MAG TPA: cytochrome c oxidase subunit 3 [Polyangium sp.]|nr:cytochrome c oxidase subunit 3 [Polyangium sp.]
MHALEPAEQFETLEKQEHAARLAMWVFLGSETLLFGGLFALYAAYRAMYPAEFREALLHNNTLLGTTNTIILITSSFTVALAVHYVRVDRSALAAALLGLSTAFGMTFLVLKFVEYADHIRHAALPAGMYTMAEAPPGGVVMGQTLYWFMTALHALHVVAGMILLGIAAIGCARHRYGRDRSIIVENAGLYWHLVDIIWIFLWPLFYLAK